MTAQSLSFKSRIARILDETLTQVEASMEADPTILIADKSVSVLEKLTKITALANDWSNGSDGLKQKSDDDLRKMFDE
jgi:hypothetical protein